MATSLRGKGSATKTALSCSSKNSGIGGARSFLRKASKPNLWKRLQNIERYSHWLLLLLPRCLFIIPSPKLLCFLFGQEQQSEVLFHGQRHSWPFRGRYKASALLENAVAVELYRRAKRKLYYLKGKKLDADFHLSDEDALIQVAYSFKGNLAFERETSALVKYAEDGHPNAKLAIVTYEEELNLDLDGFHIDSSRFGNFFLKVYKKILSMLKKTARSGLSIA